MSSPRAVLIDHSVARRVHSLDIVEEGSIVLFESHLCVQTFLSQVFENDLLALNGIVRRFNGTVLAVAIAIGIEVALLALFAFPEDVVRRESHILAVEAIVEVLEVLDEVEGTVRAGGHPKVHVHVVVCCWHFELSHHHEVRFIA